MRIIDYIENQEEAKRPPLMLVYDAIKTVLPDAQERISYGMPTLWRGRNLIHFAAMKNHIGLYPGPDAIDAFATELRPYKTSTGAIRFPLQTELPLPLIQNIARWCDEHYGK